MTSTVLKRKSTVNPLTLVMTSSDIKDLTNKGLNLNELKQGTTPRSLYFLHQDYFLIPPYP